MMRNLALIALTAGLVAATFAARCPGALVADLKTDYKAPATLGPTSDAVGIPGTLAGTWHYYQDLDGNPATSGDRTLLTFQQQGSLSNSGRAYAGSAFEFLWNMPMLSAERLFDGNTPAPPAGTLMGHPGTNARLAIEYRAHPSGQLDSVTVDYSLQTFNGLAGVRIYKSGVAGPLATVTSVNGIIQSGTATGIGTLAPGQSLWLILSAEDSFSGDQSFFKMAVNGLIVGIPEASGAGLVAAPLGGIAIVGLIRRRRRSAAA